MPAWTCALELDANRRATAGSAVALADAVRRGADLRIRTDFVHNEHIEPGSANGEIIREVSEFRVTYLIDDRWAAGIMTLRQPINPPIGFGPRPSMSFFLYNMDGGQAIARPFLDSVPAAGTPGPAPLDDHADMPKYHQRDSWDAATNAPCQNFVYDFHRFEFLVSDTWREVDVDGLTDAFQRGTPVKVAIRDLCADLGDGPTHEVFVHICSGFSYPESARFCGETQPLVRARPAVPLQYASQNWDFGWAIARTDGFVEYLRCDPYTLAFSRRQGAYALRWFIQED